MFVDASVAWKAWNHIVNKQCNVELGPRHSACLLGRFSVINGATPFELAHGRQFTGSLCEYGEPVYGFIHPGTKKAAAKWRRAIFLGKSEDQNSFVLFDGKAIVLSKNVRRITTTWRSHMAFYI